MISMRGAIVSRLFIVSVFKKKTYVLFPSLLGDRERFMEGLEILEQLLRVLKRGYVSLTVHLQLTGRPSRPRSS
jgi:hypothetical protein